MSAVHSLSEVDRQPCRGVHRDSASVRPSRSYWQQAWWRLRRNRRAMVALGILLVLLGFTYGLPAVISLDPVTQDLTQISRPPGPTQHSVLVSSEPWVVPVEKHSDAGSDSSDVGRDHGIRGLAAETATTYAVRLKWQATPAAVSYRIYRHILPPSNRQDLGLPLGETLRRGEVGFEDRLKLRPRTYHYSVLAVFGDGSESSYVTVPVTPVHATTLEDAHQRQLIPELSAAYLGERIVLQTHGLGTDHLGRDMMARLALGGQTSLLIGFVAPLLCALVAIFYGGLSGYLGGKIDEIMMRFADFVIALPFLLFMILIRVAMGVGPGESGVTPLIIALVIMGWPSAAKLVRGQVLQLREQPFIAAARLQGAGAMYLVWRHMLPNVLGVVLVSLSFAIPSAIFTEAFLSFIGMGVAPPAPSWGAMCNDGAKSFLVHPHELLLPAAFISLTVLAFNILGDGLRDALDVRAGD